MCLITGPLPCAEIIRLTVPREMTVAAARGKEIGLLQEPKMEWSILKLHIQHGGLCSFQRLTSYENESNWHCPLIYKCISAFAWRPLFSRLHLGKSRHYWQRKWLCIPVPNSVKFSKWLTGNFEPECHSLLKFDCLFMNLSWVVSDQCQNSSSSSPFPAGLTTLEFWVSAGKAGKHEEGMGISNK